jgi:hypothetical protein
MNPLASAKCAGRLLTALAVVSALLFAAACGSSSSGTSSNQQGFTSGSFSGTYVISITGTDFNNPNLVPFAIVGTVQPNGSGGFNGGTLDIIDPNIASTPQTGLALTTSGSSYSVGSDGRGTGTLVTPVATLSVAFVLSSPNGGSISLFNTNISNATGSGTIDLQSSGSTAPSAVAFSLSGGDLNANPVAVVGAFGSSGTGTIDINAGNSSSASNGTAGVAITSVTLTGSSTSGTVVINDASSNGNFNSISLDYWVIDSNDVKLDETDGNNILSGDAYAQASFPTGQVVFTVAGQDSALNPFVAGGYATAASNGSLSNGLEDYNDTVTTSETSSIPPSFSASATTNGSGRYELATDGFTNVSQGSLQFAAYPSSGGVLLLENDGNGLAVGGAFAQSATALNTSGGYALNLSGVTVGINPNDPSDFLEVDDIGQFNPGNPDSSFNGAAVNMSGNLYENDIEISSPLSSSLSGAYVPDSTNDGRGAIESTNSGTLLGGFDLQYYVVDDATVLFIDVDAESFLEASEAQVGAGVFEAQSSSGSIPAMAGAHRPLFMAHPATHLRGTQKLTTLPTTKYRPAQQ